MAEKIRFSIDHLTTVFNPYRDKQLNSERDADLGGLTTSIKKADHWATSVIAYMADAGVPDYAPKKVKNVKAFIAWLAEQKPEDQLKFTAQTPGFVVANGHRRLLAAKEVGIEYGDFTVIIASDELLLYMMAEENREDYGGSMITTVESIRKVKEMLESQLAQSEDFKAYKDLGFSAIRTAKQFSQNKGQGLGYKTVASFLKWPDNKVRAAWEVLPLFDEGVVDTTTFGKFSSMDQASKFAALIKKVSGSTTLSPATEEEEAKYTFLPPSFTDLLIEQIIKATLSNQPSSKVLRGAANAYGEGNDPVEYIKSQRKVPITRRLKGWITDCLRADIAIDSEDTDILALVDEARKALEKAIAREKAEAEAEAEQEEKLKELMEAGKTREEALADIAGDLTGTEGNELNEDILGGGGEEGDEEGSAGYTPGGVGLRSAALAASVNQTTPMLNDALGFIDEVNPEEHPQLMESLSSMLTSLTKVMVRTHGLKQVRSIVNAAAK